MDTDSKMTLPIYHSPISRRSNALDHLEHKKLNQDLFWQKIPAYREIHEATFLDHKWQMKNSLTHVEKLLQVVKDLVPQEFCKDLEEGFRKATMSVRISPYLLSIIDWTNPYHDPLRLQFVPLRSQMKPDHPKVGLDSLAEQADSPVPGLIHRYHDKALFLALDTCPVYCRFCTRSYAVGLDTEEVDKVGFSANEARWKEVFSYIRSRPELEDIVISGGDAFNLRPQQIRDIGETLLGIPHIRRFRYATKGLAVMPQKILTDSAWVDALTDIVEMGRKLHKEVVIHTHFNHPNEITKMTQDATNFLHERGITMRNQSVLLRGVNDTVEVMQLLIKRLSYINVHPYYVYVHDLVRGVEDLRPTLQTALQLEKSIRGLTAGFNIPTFVVDTPGGGGKRAAATFESYDRTSGISVYTSPIVKPGALFYYFDPLYLLPAAGQKRWEHPGEHQKMLDEATAVAWKHIQANL